MPAMTLLASARFTTTVAQMRQLPNDGLPEVAFAGRSNAGKSSALNVLCNRRRLAFASRMPGRTQALNFFAIGPQDQPSGFLVDMPGYGYATAPGAVRDSWVGLAGDYLRNRQPLVAVVLMLDIRRGVTALDHGLLAWTPTTIPVLGLLTKADKLGRNQQQAALRAVRAELALRHPRRQFDLVLFSSSHRIGLEEASDRIAAFYRLTQDLDSAPAIDAGVAQSAPTDHPPTDPSSDFPTSPTDPATQHEFPR